MAIAARMNATPMNGRGTPWSGISFDFSGTSL
jgi:hypothetical protein